ELGDYPKTNDDLIRAVADYIDFYNKRRPQRKLKGMTPEQFRSSYLSSRSFL
ncbi:MAG: IS3 family transposase, partial [Erysipelotrichaceae bacterium]|nr:IS3 family transposase [Erysipelotrichaceae bacterium]